MSLGIPYMGSKRKLASEILKIITQNEMSKITGLHQSTISKYIKRCKQNQ